MAATGGGPPAAEAPPVGTKGQAERRWCPDTWRWFTQEELYERYGKSSGGNKRYSEEETERHWRWTMQREGGTGPWLSDRSTPLKRLTLPHGCVHVTRDGERLQGRYLLLKPPGYEETPANWPVLIFLHGHHEINDANTVAGFFVGGRDRIFDTFAVESFVIVAPLVERGGALEHPRGHDYDLEGLNAVCSQALVRLQPWVDLNRVCITGYSMGAVAAAMVAAQPNSNVAAAALFAGPYCGLEQQGLPGFRKTAVRCFHNEADSYVSVNETTRLLKALGKLTDDQSPVVRTFKVLYPNNVLSFEGQISSKAFLEIRVTEYDGGSKSSWELKDAVHLADAHVCWPIIYANESTFGLFHWMLSCRANPVRAPLSARRKRLDLQRAQELLADLQEAYSCKDFRKAISSLAAKCGQDKFTFLSHMQHLAMEAQKPVLKKWGFKQASKGVIEMNAALSDHLIGLEPGASDSLQAQWDDVRRALYEKMYGDCWLPSAERGDEPPLPCPRSAASRARGLWAAPEMEEVAAIIGELRNTKAMAKKQEFIASSSRRVPMMTLESALDMQADLRDTFASPGFQEKLLSIHKENYNQPVRFALLRAELILEVQKRVLPRYGLEGNQRGVLDMLSWWQTREFDTDFRAVSDECNYLLGMPHRFHRELEAETAQRAEEAKAWLRSPEGEEWLKERGLNG